MAVGFVREVDAIGYLDVNNFNATDITVRSGQGAGNAREVVYYDRLDYFIAKFSNTSATFEWARLDPLLVDSTTSIFGPENNPITGPETGVPTGFIVGLWDVNANSQKLYAFNPNAPNALMQEVNPLNFADQLTLDPFPNSGIKQGTGTAPALGVIGHYRQGDGSAVLFETADYMLLTNCSVRDSDDIEYLNVMAQVTLSTGFATIVDTPTEYSLTGNKFNGPSLFGSSPVSFRGIQFLPDDVSTPAVPVGQLFLSARPVVNPQLGGTQNARFWYRFVEWNPTGVVSNPSRVHLRERLLTAAEFFTFGPNAPVGQLNELTQSALASATQPVFIPRTSEILFISKTPDITSPIPGTGEQKFVFVNLSPTVDKIGVPSAIELIATGKTVGYRVSTLGSLSEPISNVDVDLTLRRVSSVDEILISASDTPSPGDAIAIDNGPFDPDTLLGNPIIVIKDVLGTPTVLTEGVEYVADFGTNEINFTAPEPVSGQQYNVSYRHWLTPVLLTVLTDTAEIASLKSATIVSDLNGSAVAKVVNADETPVADRWYQLDAVEG